jgi:ferredoxin
MAAPAFRGDRANYIPVGIDLLRPESAILPGAAVRRAIAAAGFRFVLHRCLCRSLEPCRKYPRDIGCLFLGEGAREIDPALGREATTEEALAHYERAAELGLVPMAGRLRWDALWLGVKNANRLTTICFCCECCCYFKIYRLLPPEAAAGLRRLEGLEIRVEPLCDGCGLCLDVCFVGAMRLENGKAVSGEDCRGCARCARACPKKAVKVIWNPVHTGADEE